MHVYDPTIWKTQILKMSAWQCIQGTSDLNSCMTPIGGLMSLLKPIDVYIPPYLAIDTAIPRPKISKEF